MKGGDMLPQLWRIVRIMRSEVRRGVAVAAAWRERGAPPHQIGAASESTQPFLSSIHSTVKQFEAIAIYIKTRPPYTLIERYPSVRTKPSQQLDRPFGVDRRACLPLSGVIGWKCALRCQTSECLQEAVVIEPMSEAEKSLILHIVECKCGEMQFCDVFYVDLPLGILVS
jgi:hypothetical protein